ALEGLEHGGAAQRALLLDHVGDLPFGARLLLPHQPEHADFQVAERRKFLGHRGPFAPTAFEVTAAAVTPHITTVAVKCRGFPPPTASAIIATPIRWSGTCFDLAQPHRNWVVIDGFVRQDSQR